MAVLAAADQDPGSVVVCLTAEPGVDQGEVEVQLACSRSRSATPSEVTNLIEFGHSFRLLAPMVYKLLALNLATPLYRW